MDSIIRHLIGRPYAARVRSPLNSTFRTFVRFSYCDFEKFGLTVLTWLRPAFVTHDITVMAWRGNKPRPREFSQTEERSLYSPIIPKSTIKRGNNRTSLHITRYVEDSPGRTRMYVWPKLAFHRRG